ncbi:AsmA family protein [Skermanella sp. TT6]|uniref:AsmA family protein n=1 Tax=Skermanella cutis TaxID=2775420 RepID=A0ABX7B9V4_9PROT|nr:AsmA family protein [Skermanella sp. TT6]QQP90972.1 AsmA family protein [Skermanella sp. TT6]
MKKLLIGFLAVLLLVVGAVLVIPSLIDWNSYKVDIAERISAATGRAVTLDGDIDLALLPRPTLSVAGARLAGLPGAAEPDMARLRKLDVRVAFMPLLSGRIQVQSIALIEPVIALEVMRDGRRNWDFTPAGNAALSSNHLAEAVQLDKVTIENGTVIYRDASAAIHERVESVDAQIVAGSLVGPFQLQGSVLARGVPLAVELTAGRMGEGGALPVRVALRQPDAAGTLRFAGIVITGAEARVQGDLRAEGPDLRPATAAVLKAVGEPPTVELPGVLRQPFAFRTAVNASTRLVELNGIELQVGDTRGTGALKYLPAGAPSPGAIQGTAPGPATGAAAGPAQGELALTFNRFDLDSWAALGGDGVPAFRLPAGLAGKLTLNIDALNYRGNIVRQARLDAGLENGSMTLRRLSALLPGGADVAVTGTLTAERGLPVADVSVDANADNLRALLEWLGYSVDRVPADRLRKFSMTSRLTGRPGNFQFAGLDLRVDTSRMTGGVAYVDRGRPGFGARLEIDRLNLDAYAPDLTGVTDTGEIHVRPEGVARPDLAGWLEGFDANLNAEIGTLTVAGIPVQQAGFDGTLSNGALSVRQFRAADAAGVSGTVQGGIRKLKPLDDIDLSIDLKAGSLVPLNRAFPASWPAALPPADRLGEAALKGRVAGDPERLALDLTFAGGGGSVQAGGSLSQIATAPNYDIKVRATHPDAARLMQLFAPDWRPAGTLGAFDVYAEMAGSDSALSLSAIQGTAGPVSVQGEATIDLAGERAAIDARLQTGEIVIDQFLQASSRALVVPSLIQPALAAEGTLWSEAPISLDWLRAIDGKLALTSRAIVHGDRRLADPAVRARLEGGTLTVEQLDGGAFGGRIGLSGSLTAAPGAPPRVTARLAVVDADLARLRTGPAGVDLAEGVLNLDLDIDTVGTSPAALVAALGGTGRIVVREGTLSGMDLEGALAAVTGADKPKQALDQVARAMAGGESPFDRLAGTLTIDRGVVRSDDLAMTAPNADITGGGSASLTDWSLDLGLGVKLLADPELPAFGLTLAGPLDRPRRTLETGELAEVLESRAAESSRRKAADARPLPPGAVVVPVEPAPAR